MLIEVTQQDIDHGHKGFGGSCPVALAIKRLRNYPDPHTSAYKFFHNWHDISNDAGIRLPAQATEWIHRYDKGYPCKPFSFELDLPE